MATDKLLSSIHKPVLKTVPYMLVKPIWGFYSGARVYTRKINLFISAELITGTFILYHIYPFIMENTDS